MKDNDPWRRVVKWLRHWWAGKGEPLCTPGHSRELAEAEATIRAVRARVEGIVGRRVDD